MSGVVQNCPYVLGVNDNNNVVQKSAEDKRSKGSTTCSEGEYVFDGSVFRSSSLPLELPPNNTENENCSSSDAELSDTESAHQAMSLSSPEDGPHPGTDGENGSGLKHNEDKDGRQSHDGRLRDNSSNPASEEDDNENEGDGSNDKKLCQSNERVSSSSEGSDCSDYVTSCNLIGPVRHDVRKAERLIIGLMSKAKLARTPEESDEQYARRVRKHNYLSMAQEFAARNRMPSGVEDKQAFGVDLTRSAPVHLEGSQRDFSAVSREDSREWVKNVKNSAKCIPSEVWQSASTAAHRRPCSFEAISLKDSPNLLLPVNSFIGAPSPNQNAIHRHHQRSLAKYDACLSKERDCPRELPIALPNQVCQFAHVKMPPRAASESSNEPANKARNRYSDLPANMAKMALCVPPVGAVHHEGKDSGYVKGTRRSSSGTSRAVGTPVNLGKRRPIRDGRLQSREELGSYRNVKVPSPPHEIHGSFDVYNIETTMPTIDWIAMEDHLAKAAKEEMFIHKQHRNNREEIRRKLAMGSDADDYYGGERTGKKPSLQSRLQSGMNLQICFMNETVTDQDIILGDPHIETTANTVQNMATTVEKTIEPVLATDAESSMSTLKTLTKVPLDEATDIISKQARLQAEARLALAQAKQMAHMQMEVEKQRKKKSPIAEMVGIPFPDGRHKVSRHALSEMNVAQLQVIVNDLHTQIESLNEELVRLLLERDDLHMEQDSMLVDIEDLTRYL